MNIPSPLSLKPDEFEIAVMKSLQYDTSCKLHKFVVHGKRLVAGIDGEYEIDASAEFELFDAKFKVLIECKRYNKPVNRDLVMVLCAKLQSTAMHKGIMYSTSGFQSGAIKYARKHGIALIHLQDGSSTALTKSERSVHLTNTYVGWVLFPSDNDFCQVALVQENRDVLIRALTPDSSLEDGSEDN